MDPAERKLLEAADFLKSLGPQPEHLRAPDPKTRIVDGKIRMLCACEKVVNVLEMPRKHSGVVPYIDNVCPGCPERAKGLATVVCVSCHKVAGRMPPFTDKHGFRVEAGRVYHIQRCPGCHPGDFRPGQTGEIARTPVIEMLLHHKARGVIL